ncbi:MAG: hypothetical protein IKV40_06830 [Clostridia bacterium]|nr:hypothetical protein [Clostridia bacterium]MBR5632699.1 hypothetical protein [Clostridia bacterium]
MMQISYRPLSGNALKIIGAAVMLIDHIGVLFFPRVIALRIIGRLAFPIFAYLIAEGCRHTKNRRKYFLNLLGFGVLFQLVYHSFTGSSHMNIFISYALSLPMIYSLQLLKDASNSKRTLQITAAFVSVIASVVFAYVFHESFSVDYGFEGTLVPFASSICMSRGKLQDAKTQSAEHVLSVLFCGVSLILLAYPFRGVQIYSLLALPLLLAYSGKRGSASLKYFFYIFYPAHLVLLYGIKTLLNHLS